jgi:hypothetical protein
MYTYADLCNLMLRSNLELWWLYVYITQLRSYISHIMLVDYADDISRDY